MQRVLALVMLSCGSIVGVLCAGVLKAHHPLSLTFDTGSSIVLYGRIVSFDASQRVFVIAQDDPYAPDTGARELAVSYDESTLLYAFGSVDDGPGQSPGGSQVLSIADMPAHEHDRAVKVSFAPDAHGILTARIASFMN
jgi:hypothetical protein